MARITVEDYVLRVPSRFELVMVRPARPRHLGRRASSSIDRDNDKNPVVALREIAEGTVDLDHLRYELIHGLRRHVDLEPETPMDLAEELEALIPPQEAGIVAPMPGGCQLQRVRPRGRGLNAHNRVPSDREPGGLMTPR